MTEEIVPEAGGENTDLSPIQEKALEQGWKPKDQFEGNEDEFIDAPEFVRRGELFGKIEHQGKELKAVRQALEALKQHNSKIEQSAYDKALKSLQETRKQAFIEGETERAFAIEDQIELVKEEKSRLAQQSQQPAVQEINPTFQAWVDKNKWYTTDVAMQAVADRIGTEMARRGVPQDEVLDKVVREVREAFPHKFQNTNRERPSAVEASNRGGSSAVRSTQAMSEDERNIMRKIVNTGVMTEKEYMDQLKKAKA